MLGMLAGARGCFGGLPEEDMSRPKITFGPQRRVDSLGQTRVEVRFGWQPVGYLCRWHGDLAFSNHGWFFETDDLLSRAVFDYGFPPVRVSLADAKRDLVRQARAHDIGKEPT